MDLSVLIPSRNEMFLSRTIQDILEHSEADTEIIAVLDGQWAEPPIPQNPRVTILHYPESIGQRAATNAAARVASGDYFMKVDAHCAFAQGFDRIMLEDMRPEYTVAPLMRNLHAFDWVCENGHRRYQGPSGPCGECGAPTRMDILWIAKPSPQSTSYCFDPEPHFQYFADYKKRPGGKGDLTESMSLQGSCFMISRERYFDLNVCDEEFGSWGSQGIEVAAKTWLSGGKVMINHRTWYAHLFRTQGGDFSFPYPLSGKQVSSAKKKARQLFFENKWPKQIHPLSWLVERFWPVPGWSDADLAALKSCETSQNKPPAGALYYTDNRLDPHIMTVVQSQLRRSLNGHQLVSVSLQPIDFGNNIVLPFERGYLTMFRQILAGLEAMTSDVVFFTEHDILYAPGYFDFVPPEKDKIYYNTNVWHLRASDGHALYYTAKRLSQLCAYRAVLIEHYRKRVERVERDGFTRKIGFEPGTHNRPERIDDLKSDIWVAKYPNVDIKHGKNLTPARWSQDKFRNQRHCRDWKEADEIPYWGVTKNRFDEFIRLIGNKVDGWGDMRELMERMHEPVSCAD